MRRRLGAVRRTVSAVAFLAAAVSSGEAAEADAVKERGRALTVRMCAECHAIDKTGESPHRAAPAFRDLDRRLDLDGLMERLRRGLMSGHQDMPMFRFSREEARAVATYLRSIQAP
jgi:mono/diheme cytochrome c family protein